LGDHERHEKGMEGLAKIARGEAGEKENINHQTETGKKKGMRTKGSKAKLELLIRTKGRT